MAGNKINSFRIFIHSNALSLGGLFVNVCSASFALNSDVEFMTTAAKVRCAVLFIVATRRSHRRMEDELSRAPLSFVSNPLAAKTVTAKRLCFDFGLSKHPNTILERN